MTQDQAREIIAELTDTLEKVTKAHERYALADYHTIAVAVPKLRALLAHIAAVEAENASLSFKLDFSEKNALRNFNDAQARINEVSDLKAYIAKTAKEVAQTIQDMRERDKSVELRMRAEAAERERDELRAALGEPIGYASKDVIEALRDGLEGSVFVSGTKSRARSQPLYAASATLSDKGDE